MNKTALILFLLSHSTIYCSDPIQSKEEAFSLYAKRTIKDAVAVTKIATGGVVLMITGMSISMIRKQRAEWAPRGGALILFSMTLTGGFTVWSGARDFNNTM